MTFEDFVKNDPMELINSAKPYHVVMITVDFYIPLPTYEMLGGNCQGIHILTHVITEYATRG